MSKCALNIFPNTQETSKKVYTTPTTPFHVPQHRMRLTSATICILEARVCSSLKLIHIVLLECTLHIVLPSQMEQPLGDV